ncbi:MAG: dienelactone hydrolase family protein [Lysobacterales bacterium]
MNDVIELLAADGHRFHVWRALPTAAPLGSVIVLQEIFGVNSHIRDLCAQFAANGYAAFAPWLFDRCGGNVELGYDPEGIAQGRELMAQLRFDDALLDVAAIQAVAAAHGPVACVGYCWGGSLAWLAATRLGIPSVSYYGARTAPFLDETPRAPILMHFGERDPSIPAAFVDQLRQRHPQIPVHVYAAGHGFNCNQRSDFHAESAALAWRRSLAFLREALRPSEEFVLHPRLQQDAIELGDLALCRVLLMNDARYPWIILVPRLPDCRELTDLDPARRAQLIEELALAEHAMQAVFDPEKLNLALLGNRVPQLHAHVIARYSSDPAWPDTVWNRGEAEPYRAGQVHATLLALRAALGLHDSSASGA